MPARRGHDSISIYSKPTHDLVYIRQAPTALPVRNSKPEVIDWQVHPNNPHVTANDQNRAMSQIATQFYKRQTVHV